VDELVIKGIVGGPKRVRARGFRWWVVSALLAGGMFLLGAGAGLGGRVFHELRTGERRLARQASAIRTLKEICVAEGAFGKASPEGLYGDLAALVSARLVGADLSTGERDGYRFHVAPSAQYPQFFYAAIAEPVEGRRATSVATNHTGVMFFVDDGPISVNANSCDLPLGPPWTSGEHFWGYSKGGPPPPVPTVPVEGGLWGDR